MTIMSSIVPADRGAKLIERLPEFLVTPFSQQCLDALVEPSIKLYSFSAVLIKGNIHLQAMGQNVSAFRIFPATFKPCLVVSMYYDQNIHMEKDAIYLIFSFSVSA